MKIKARSFIVLFASVLIAVSAAWGFAQKKDQGDIEENKVVIDVSQIGKKLGVPEDEIGFVDGSTFKLQRWNKEHIVKAIDELRYCFKEPGNTYLLTEVPAPWITLALIQALQPLKVHYLYPAPGGDELEMIDLKRGKQSPNYDVDFEVIEQGDNVYINLNSDTPETETTGKHTFDLANLPRVVIPDIPAGKNVFIHGKGMYGVMVCIARNYIKNCKSLSMAAHETDYICAVSFTNEREIGDVTHRTIQNNL
jgi:hypothetical protein